MTETGKVIKESKGIITVRFERKTECDKCRMCAFSKNMTYFDLNLENTVNAREGDTVIVSVQSGAVLFSSFIVYIIPLIIAAAGFTGGYLLWGEALSVVCGAVFLALGFFSLSFLDKYLKKKNKITGPHVIGIKKASADK
jgi:positive regulator of sigma E activity